MSRAVWLAYRVAVIVDDEWASFEGRRDRLCKMCSDGRLSLRLCYPHLAFAVPQNAPWLVRSLWKIAQKFIDPVSRSKVGACLLLYGAMCHNSGEGEGGG